MREIEHIVQFGISIDDDAIKKSIEKNVMMQVANSIRNDAMKSIVGKKDCTSLEYTSKLKEIVETVAGEFLETNKEEKFPFAAAIFLGTLVQVILRYRFV